MTYRIYVEDGDLRDVHQYETRWWIKAIWHLATRYWRWRKRFGWVHVDFFQYTDLDDE